MAKSSLFSDEAATDRSYINIRGAKNDKLKEAKEHCEALWELFEPFADPQFLVELRSNFDARYWEMYLGAYFIEHGFEVEAPKPGPDLGIHYNGCRIWFEAVSPTRGADGNPDQVPEMKFDGTVQNVPEEKIILRYLNSISEKYQRQYSQWTKTGTISDKDAFVIALNPRRIGFEHGDTEPPRILQAAFTIGSFYVTVNRDTLKEVRTGYHFRNEIPKTSGKPVSTGVFQQDSAGLSGLLCSRVDAANRPALNGSDFQLVANPHATIPLPGTFRLDGTYFNVSEVKNGYDAKIEAAVGVRGDAKA
jgi:hypothetical protein